MVDYDLDKYNLTQEELKKHLIYYPETGMFQRINGNRFDYAGEYARRVEHLNIKNDRYRANLLAWMYVYGEWPKNKLIHKDNNRLNNKINNLKELDEVHVSSIYVCPGVRLRRNKYVAQIWTGLTTKHLGCFNTPEAARDAYNEQAKKYGRKIVQLEPAE